MAECLPRQRQRSHTNGEEVYVIRNGSTVLNRTTSEDFMEQSERRPQKPPPLAPKPQLSRPSSTSSLSSIGKNKVRSKKKDEEIEESLRRIRGQGKYVKLNVGGSLHYTTLATLTKHDNMLRAMFSERIPLERDDEGWVLLDRSGTYFGLILNYLRDSSVSLPETKKECLELLAEAKYYCIDELVEAVETQLAKLKDEHQPICRVPVITSLDEEHLIVSTSATPVIKLLYNRGNNKYSYTSNSDDNLLKNIELFDKLAVRFGTRVKFMKDIVGRGEICCWAFYGRGKKIAEVCCESIVYATDRKHTKIEFPEAKILDETLNIMLYENRSEDTPPGNRDHFERPPGTPEGRLSEEEY